MMSISVNGRSERIADGDSVADLLRTLGLAEKRVAVELNRAIVPKSRHAAVHLKDGDEVEIVQAIGGG
jgi:sulfur carrier protein